MTSRKVSSKPVSFFSAEQTVRLHVVIFLMLALCSCAIPISYYDSTTYRHLTELKAETMMLVESFDSKPYAQNKSAIDTAALNLRKAYEYEIGKGKPNSGTYKQFNKIMELFKQDITDYREGRPGDLGPKYFQEAAVILGQAFDIAIATENEKNTDKR